MTAIESMKQSVEHMRARIEALRTIEEAAREERHTVELALEEAEGRAEGPEARWLRAWQAKDYDLCNGISEQRRVEFEARMAAKVNHAA
jgi:hypothetical protein